MRLATSFTAGNRFAQQHLTEVLNATGTTLRTGKKSVMFESLWKFRKLFGKISNESVLIGISSRCDCASNFVLFSVTSRLPCLRVPTRKFPLRNTRRIEEKVAFLSEQRTFPVLRPRAKNSSTTSKPRLDLPSLCLKILISHGNDVNF